jgi:GNAT superfamily N-acetyltransferase
MDDLEDLLAIDHEAVGRDPERISAIKAHVSEGHCWVHPGEAHFDAYAVVLPRHFFRRDFLDLLVVESSARRSGIATNLLRALLGLKGTHQVFTSTNRSNAPMRALLSKEGWQLSGELDGLDPEDPELFFFTWRF